MQDSDMLRVNDRQIEPSHLTVRPLSVDLIIWNMLIKAMDNIGNIMTNWRHCDTKFDGHRLHSWYIFREE